jgi:hypothetical protein
MGLDVGAKLKMAIMLIVFIMILIGVTPMVNTQFTAAQTAANAGLYTGNTTVAAFWALAPFLWGLFIAVVVILAIVAEVKV